MSDPTNCPDPETLAAFVDGNLKRHEIAAILAHLDVCARCRRVVVSAGSESRATTPHWSLIAAAAAALLVLFSIPAFRSPSLTERLVKLAPSSARLLEPRLSADFAWAPWRGPMRSTGRGETDPQRLQLAGVAGDLVARANREPSPNAQHDAGVALVLIDEPLAAVTRLRDAVARDPSNARVWSDLAAAEYAAAARLARPSLYPEALAAADRAVRIDARLPAALFNRALILEQLGLTAPAREAWMRYLAVDGSSLWATEGRAHLARLPQTTVESTFRHDLPSFEKAAAAGENVDAFIDRYRQQARTFGEAEHLGLWGEAELSGNADEAGRLLAIARATGNALLRRSGESLLHDDVAAIDGAHGERRRLFATAHQLYRQGRIAYGREQPSAAEPDLRRAAKELDQAHSPMALVARYFAACTRYDQNDVDAAEKELEVVLAAADAQPAYIALGAEVRWQLALCRMSRDDWTGALPIVVRAEEAFRRLDERSNLGFLKTLLADTLLCLGRVDEAWAARVESFRIQSAEGRADRLPVSIGGAARTELRAGRLDSARAMLQLEAAADRAIGSDLLLANALMREALLAGVLGDHEAAAGHARDSAEAARRIQDEGLRSRATADARLAEGAVLLERDPRRSIEELTYAIDTYERTDRTHFLPEAHLLRARARLRVEDKAGAADELERGIALLEQHPIHLAGPVVGTGIFDAGRELYREAIALALERHDIAAAFAYAERSRTRVGAVASAADIQERLRGSEAVVVEIVALRNEVVAFCVTDKRLSVARQAMPRAELETLASAAVRGEQAARSKLYDLLFRAAGLSIADARHLIVVADPVLDDVPFGALYDSESHAYLVERIPVSMALSASSLRPARQAPPRSIATLDMPSGEKAGTVALPQVARELAAVRALYPRALETTSVAFAGADVIHIAGHTENATTTGDALLHLDDGTTASWTSIAGQAPIPGSIVVLAACETLRRPRADALSLGGGFLAAGASDVIGTLEAIADEDAYDLFRDVHRQLAAGLSADQAVQHAQLTVLASRRAVDWASLAVLTRRIPNG